MKETKKELHFYNGLTDTKPLETEDLHNEFVEQYEEILPFQTNEETGEVENKTRFTIWKKKEPLNMYEYIQSNADDADLTKKIESLTNLNERKGVYIDTTEYGNIHDVHEKSLEYEQKIALLEKEIELEKLKATKPEEPKPEEPKPEEPKPEEPKENK